MRSASLLRKTAKSAACTALIVALALAWPALCRAQDTDVSGPTAALTAALSAACRANGAAFASYLTADSAAAFRALPSDQQSAFLKRFSLSDTIGKPLLSNDAEKHSVLRCQASGATVEYVFDDPQIHENLAYIPVSVMNGQSVRFGLVREHGGWHLLSVGLVMLDVPELAEQWKQEEVQEHDDAVIETLRNLAGVIGTYKKLFGKLPESLAQLGPAPKDQVSPDQASLVDQHLAAGDAGGYRFRYAIVPAAGAAPESFELGATPDEYGKTGRTSFFYDAVGKIHAADKLGAIAGPSDPVISGEANDEKQP
ncbi:MAG TPA: hypothetical protein VN661_01250 [Candidatus Acidoferrales bacterium]|nr:hypothetical protein [Candidatus Acidoferrales bacterium]